jgi:hypothetical protein
MGNYQMWSSRRLDSWPSVSFLFYMNDLPKIINSNDMVPYTDDSSIIITDTNKLSFQTNLNQTFKDINTWYNFNLLILNFNKTQYLELWPMNCCQKVTHIKNDQKIISNVTDTRFLGLTIDDVLFGKQHIHQVINRLSSVCYTLWNIKYIV